MKSILKKESLIDLQCDKAILLELKTSRGKIVVITSPKRITQQSITGETSSRIGITETFKGTVLYTDGDTSYNIGQTYNDFDLNKFSKFNGQLNISN